MHLRVVPAQGDTTVKLRGEKEPALIRILTVEHAVCAQPLRYSNCPKCHNLNIRKQPNLTPGSSKMAQY